MLAFVNGLDVITFGYQLDASMYCAISAGLCAFIILSSLLINLSPRQAELDKIAKIKHPSTDNTNPRDSTQDQDQPKRPGQCQSGCCAGCNKRRLREKVDLFESSTCHANSQRS